MKKIFTLLMCMTIKFVFAEAPTYPVDFDQGYFHKSPFSRWMRDPFKNPPGFAKAAMTPTKWPKLSSIVMKEDVPLFAILDGKKYREGQFINETRYISVIGQNYVIITEGSFDYELVVPDPTRSLAGSRPEDIK